MKTWLPITLTLLLSACGYGWKVEPAVYPPSQSSGVVVNGQGASAVTAGAGEYVVQPGDTLFAIGFRNQLDYHELASWNNIGSDYLIRTGQLLRLTPPVGSDAVLARPLALPTMPSDKPVPIQSSDAALPGPVTQPPPVAAPVINVPVIPKPLPQSASALHLQWPTAGSVIKTYNMVSGSKGIDITGDLGQPVQAVTKGKVVYSGSALKGYGELIIIKHDETYLSAYGHNRRRLVKEGEEVQAGQTIAELGLGPEQKPILHFEIRENGKPVDPLQYLPAR